MDGRLCFIFLSISNSLHGLCMFTVLLMSESDELESPDQLWIRLAEKMGRLFFILAESRPIERVRELSSAGAKKLAAS